MLIKPKRLQLGDAVATLSPSWGGAGNPDLRWRYQNDHTETVVMKVSIGSFTDAVAIGLKKDQNIWKLDIPSITE